VPWARLAARAGLRLISIVLFLWLWHLGCKHKVELAIIDFRNLPSPMDVLDAARELIQSPKLWSHTRSSLFRIFSGFAIAGLSGVCLGLAIGRSRVAEDLLMTPLEILRPIPAVAWIPLAILMVPSSEGSTIHGVQHVDPKLVAASRSLGAKRLTIFREVVLPGALPSIVTGLSIGMGTSWFSLVTAEMISGQFGIGYYTWEAYNLQNYGSIVVGMIAIGTMGMASSALVRSVGGIFLPWHRIERKASR
jgi:NitT/TauT family transport system permease protein